MSLTCTLATYLKFKERKRYKLNHFRFWRIKKWLNEEISESRLIDHEKRQNEDIMSLEYEQWPLWSKKKGKKTWEMRHEARFSCIEIWNSKSSGNMYSDFEDKFGVIPKIHFRHTIYRFEAREVKSPTLQMVYKSELKWRSDGNLKTTAQSSRVISKWFWNSTYDSHLMFCQCQFWIHPLSLWCFASSTLTIASKALHLP